jgi:hypothetical protein
MMLATDGQLRERLAEDFRGLSDLIRRIEPMQWMSLGLVVVLGGATSSPRRV